jgi:hypothetical protein
MSKKAQLVSQHLENVSRKALEDHQDIIHRYVRHRQGIYVLYRKGKLHYVGLATDLRNRLRQHLSDRLGQSWDRFSIYFTIGDAHLREIESIILRATNPPANKQKGAFLKSEDVKPQFRRDIKKSVINEVEGLFDSPGRTDILIRPLQSKDNRPILAHYKKFPSYLRASYKGRAIFASVRKDGKIRFAGKNFDSPSSAAMAACRRASCNGWTFWQYERAPGDWIYLDNLRK